MGWHLTQHDVLCPSAGSGRLNPASLGLQARVRPLPLLIATGGGYMGYDQYGRYKDRELARQGIEVPPRIANEAQVGRQENQICSFCEPRRHHGCYSLSAHPQFMEEICLCHSFATALPHFAQSHRGFISVRWNAPYPSTHQISGLLHKTCFEFNTKGEKKAGELFFLSA